MRAGIGAEGRADVMAVIRAPRIHTSLGTLTRWTPHPANPCPRTPFPLDRFGCVKVLNILHWEHRHHSLTRCLHATACAIPQVSPQSLSQMELSPTNWAFRARSQSSRLDPYHEHPDGRCMPHVTGTICHIACTTTPWSRSQPSVAQTVPCAFFPKSATSAAVLARKILSNVAHCAGHLGETRGRGTLASLSFNDHRH